MFFYHEYGDHYIVDGESKSLPFAGHIGGSSPSFWADLSPDQVEELSRLCKALICMREAKLNGHTVFWLALFFWNLVSLLAVVLAKVPALVAIFSILIAPVLTVFASGKLFRSKVNRVRRRIAELYGSAYHTPINKRVLYAIVCLILRPDCRLPLDRNHKLSLWKFARPHKRGCCSNWQQELDYRDLEDTVRSELVARIVARDPELFSVIGDELAASVHVPDAEWSPAAAKFCQIVREECAAEEERHNAQVAKEERQKKEDAAARRAEIERNREVNRARAEGQAEVRALQLRAALGKTPEEVALDQLVAEK